MDTNAAPAASRFQAAPSWPVDGQPSPGAGSAPVLFAFPPGFLWGTATAAHQVEGQNFNADWWLWEQQPGRIRDGSTSRLACDHLRRYREDFDLLAHLHQNAHRLSVEWARIEPRPGEFDPAALAHYRRVLEALRERGIEPIVTLHHFTNPRWLAERGGWERPEVVDLFSRYVRRVVAEYDDLVRYWVTINEPGVYAYMSYLEGLWPPGVRSRRRAFQVARHMAYAHARAYHTVHDTSRRGDVRVGLAHHMRIFDPHRPRVVLDRVLARIADYLFNWCLLCALIDGVFRFPLGYGQRVALARDSLDFIGLNYYSRDRVTFDIRRPHRLFGRDHPPTSGSHAPLSGWEIYPEGIYRLLRALSRFNKPILITENGIAEEGDDLRPAFILSHLLYVHRAIAEGAPVIGYLHWSALDNFEWIEGLRWRFGLIHVDFATQERRIKPSGYLYGQIAAANGLTAPMIERYAPALGDLVKPVIKIAP